MDYNSAHVNARASSTNRPLAKGQITSWHWIMCRSVVPVHYYAGNFRQVDQNMPCLNVEVQFGPATNRLNGSPAVEVPNRMLRLVRKVESAFDEFNREWDKMPPEARTIRFASILSRFLSEFIRIHPFRNGNGRTSRLLWSWALARYGLPAICSIGERPGHPYAEDMFQASIGNCLPLQQSILMGLAGPPEQQN